MVDPEELPIEKMADDLLRRRLDLARPSISVEGNALRDEATEEKLFRAWVKGQYEQLIQRLGHRMRKDFDVMDTLEPEVQERVIARARSVFLDYKEHWRTIFEKATSERERKRQEQAEWMRRREGRS